MGRFLSQPEITKSRSSLTISFPKNHKIRQPEVCWWYRGWLNYLIFLGKNYPRNTIILEIILHGIPCSSLEGIKSIGIMPLTAQTNTLTLLINIFLLFSSNWKSQKSALAGSSLIVSLTFGNPCHC